MADLRRKANWLIPWLLMSIVSMSFVFAMEKRIGWDLIVRTQIEKSSNAESFDQLSPADKQQRLDSVIRITKYSSYLIPLSSLLWFAALAAALVAVFRFAVGAGITYGRTLAIVVYGSLPSLIERLAGDHHLVLRRSRRLRRQKPHRQRARAVDRPRDRRRLCRAPVSLLPPQRL